MVATGVGTVTADFAFDPEAWGKGSPQGGPDGAEYFKDAEVAGQRGVKAGLAESRAPQRYIAASFLTGPTRC
jgi:hypothetical protein